MPRTWHLRAGILATLLFVFTAGSAEAQTLIPPGSNWKYNDSGVNLQTAWRAVLNGSANGTLTVSPAPSFNPIRVNTGGGAFTDTQARLWSADIGFNGGGTGSVPASRAISNTVDDALYRRCFQWIGCSEKAELG